MLGFNPRSQARSTARSRTGRVAVAFAAAAFALTITAEARAQDTVAILGLEVTGSGSMDTASLQLAKSLTESLRSQPGELGGPYRLAPNASKGLAEMKLLAGCDNEGARCMATIGQALDATHLVYGKIERIESGAKVSIQLLDVAGARKLKGVTDVVPTADWKDLDPWARSFYARLVGLPLGGTLAITANASTGTVMIDGEVATSLTGRQATVDELPAGRHQVAVQSPGYERWSGEVDVVPGRQTALDVTLDPIRSTAEPPMDKGAGGHGAARAAFWTSLGIGAAAGAFQLVNWFVLRDNAQSDVNASLERLRVAGAGQTGSEYESLLAAGMQRNTDDPCDGPAKEVYDASGNPSRDLRALNDACSNGRRTELLSYTAGGVAIVAGAAAAFFYYKGYVADDPEEDAHAVRLTPSIGPRQAGLGLTIDF